MLWHKDFRATQVRATQKPGRSLLWQLSKYLHTIDGSFILLCLEYITLPTGFFYFCGDFWYALFGGNAVYYLGTYRLFFVRSTFFDTN